MDLPGLTQVAKGDQPKNIHDLIVKSISKYMAGKFTDTNLVLQACFDTNPIMLTFCPFVYRRCQSHSMYTACVTRHDKQ